MSRRESSVFLCQLTSAVPGNKGFRVNNVILWHGERLRSVEKVVEYCVVSAGNHLSAVIPFGPTVVEAKAHRPPQTDQAAAAAFDDLEIHSGTVFLYNIGVWVLAFVTG